MEAQVEDFTATRGSTVHRLAFELMTAGAPVHSTVDIADLDLDAGAVVALNHHLLPPDQLEAVLAYRDGPLVLIGRDVEGLPTPDRRLEDSSGPGSLVCLVYGAEVAEAPIVEPWEPPALPEDLMGMDEPAGYWDHFEFQPVSPEFVRASAQIIAEVSGGPRVFEEAEAVTVMATEETSGKLRVALKNATPYYARPRVDVGAEIASVDILTEYPSLLVRPEGSTFSVRVPPKGVTVVEVTTATR